MLYDLIPTVVKCEIKHYCLTRLTKFIGENMSQDFIEEPKKLISISKRAFIIFIVILLMVVLWLLWPFLPNRGVGQYANIDEHFPYYFSDYNLTISIQ